MNIGNHKSVGDRDGLHAADRLVFTNGRDIVGQHVLNSTTGGIICSDKRFDIVGFERQCHVGNLGYKILKLVILGNKIGFAVHFDCNAAGACNRNANQAFGRGTA